MLLTLDEPIKRLTYQNGGYLNWWDNYMVIDPLSDGLVFEAGTSRIFVYCAEPAVLPVAVEMGSLL